MKYKPLSREFLLKRGYCCNNKCQNCPYKTTKMDRLAFEIKKPNEKSIT